MKLYLYIFVSLCFYSYCTPATGACSLSFQGRSTEVITELEERILSLKEINSRTAFDLANGMNLSPRNVMKVIAKLRSEGRLKPRNIKRARTEDEVQEERVKAISNSYPAVVKLLSESDDKQGTAFFISSKVLVTAYHCTYDNNCLERRLYFRNTVTGERVYTKVLSVDQESDLALLEVLNYESEHFYPVGSPNKTEFNFLKEINFEETYQEKKDQFVIIPGFPHNFFHIIRGITVSGSRGRSLRIDLYIEEEIGYQEISTYNGLSGAPVLSTSNRLVGIAIRQSFVHLGETEAYIQFVFVEELRDLIRKARKNRKIKKELSI